MSNDQTEIFKGEIKQESKRELNHCCFCGEECNIYSQSCGRCSRTYSISRSPVNFWWEREEEEAPAAKDKIVKKSS